MSNALAFARKALVLDRAEQRCSNVRYLPLDLAPASPPSEFFAENPVTRPRNRMGRRNRCGCGPVGTW